MPNRTIEYYSSDGDSRNITTVINTTEDLRFKESFIVSGGVINANDIYANYDLKILGDLNANNVTILGNLYVSGRICVNKLVCSNNVTCEGSIEANEIIVDELIFCENIVSSSLLAHAVMVKESVDVTGTINIKGTLYAADGIIGEGNLEVENAISLHYIDFSGEVDGNIYDLSSEPDVEIEDQHDNKEVELTIGEKARSIIKELQCLEEDEFVEKVKELGRELPNLQVTDFLIDRVIELTYKSKIDNLTDYLIAFWAMKEFPTEVQEYETIKPVLTDMIKAVDSKCTELPFISKDPEDIAYSLYVINRYRKHFSDKYESLADTIFSRIGIRYKTVIQLLNRE